jgi:4-hydroxybenzoate polyprenyltransferase
MKLLNKISELIKNLENLKIPFIYYILTFFSAVILRIFLESFFDGYVFIHNQPICHFFLFYLSLALALSILFHFATRESIDKILKVILPAFLILIIVPILDVFVFFVKDYDPAYMFPGEHKNLLLSFFKFFGHFEGKGITPGMRVEVGLVILGSFIYFFIKRGNIIRSLLFSFLTYCLIFLYLAMPFVMNSFFHVFRLYFDILHILIIDFYLLQIFILGICLFYLFNKNYFIEIVKDIRPLRLLHFELMFVLGVVLAKGISPKSTVLITGTQFDYIFIIIAILSAWVFSVITNNIIDYDIDKISNKTRPSVLLTIPTQHYKYLSWAFLLLAIIYSSAVNFRSLFLILLFIGNYFLYSMPPFRLKRIPFFSKLLISLNSLILVILGCVLVVKSLYIPASIIVFFLVCFTAAVNFIDLKDYQGDKKSGIRTLPTILGLRKSKILIGIFFVIAYNFVYFMFKDAYLLVPLIILSIIQFFLINKRNYNERPVFVVYLSSIVMLIIYIISFAQV